MNAVAAGAPIHAPSLLLVDDDDVMCAALARALARRGYQVLIAHDGASALAAVREHRPGHAVLDLRLPDRSGLQVLAQARASHPAIRVVMLTGHGSICTAVEAMKLGAVHYLTKPADADDIVAAFHCNRADPEVPVAAKPMTPGRVEWEHINRVLLQYRGNISATARALSLHRRTLQRKLAKHASRD